MADTFTTSLSIRQIETGTRSGTWGTETNTQYELLDNAFSYVANDLASDADATLTISDGTASNARYFYIKFTSAVSLTATRTITLAPDDSSKIWIVENATTGSQALTFKQGSSGSTVTVSNGNTAMIYADGAGATNGAITNAFTDLQLAGTTSVAGLDAGSGSITTTGTVTGNTLAGTLSTAAQPNITSVGTLTGFTSTGIDDNATSTAITIDSSENVGIGVSPSYKLHISGTSGSNILRVQDTGNNAGIGIGADSTDGAEINYGGVDTLRFVNVSTERARITSAGNVGINTTNPQGDLTVSNAGAEGIEFFAASGSNINSTQHYNRSGAVYVTNKTIAADHQWFNGGSEKMRITSAGNLGIGATTVDEKIHVEVTSGDAALKLEDAVGGYMRIDQNSVGATNLVRFKSGGSLLERMRIDSSGYILAGTTSDAAANKVGQIVAASGIITTEAAITTTNGTVDVTVPAGGIMITAQSGYSEDAAIFTFKADGGSQGCFGTGIGNSNWAFGTTSEPGGLQRNKVWVQTANTLRFKDNGYGARTYQLTILSNTN